MGKDAKAKLAAVNQMLPRVDVPKVAALALMETLLIDIGRTDEESSGNREVREYRARLRENMRKDVERYHGTFTGKVEDGLILKCDRYLCAVQNAMDTFFDDLTPEDLAEMERVKANWPQHTEAA